MKNKFKDKKEIWLSILILICVILLINPVDYGSVGEKIVISLTVPVILGSFMILLKPHKHNKDCNCVCDEEECKKY